MSKPGPISALRRRVPSGLRHQVKDLTDRVTALEAELRESRRTSQRLADVVEVVTELLVPAMDRDDERVRSALSRLDKA